MPYRVELAHFQGTMDELLTLARKREVELLLVPLATVISQYLAQLMESEQANLEQAGEFLVVAASLIYLKSKFLLPAADQQEEEELLPDPSITSREYEKIREVASALWSQNILGRDVFCPALVGAEQLPEEPAIDLEEANVFLLARAFFSLLENLSPEEPYEIEPEPITVSEKMGEIIRRLSPGNRVSFRALLSSPYTRRELIVTFLALLELVRLKHIGIVQQDIWGDILIFAIGYLLEEEA